MRVVDSLIVNDLFELDLLLLKLRLESPVVDEFVLNESSFDYRGRFKGMLWQAAIDADSRFDPYRHKVTVLHAPENLSGVTPGEIGDAIDPPQYDQAERRLRELSTDYVLGKYSDGDRVFTSDVDEVIDFSDEYRRAKLLELLESGRALQIERIRYSFDYDIRSFRSPLDIVNPVFTVGQIRGGYARLSDKKWLGDPVPLDAFDTPLVFEYCHCFRDREAVHVKHATSLHTRWTRKGIDDAIDTATWPQTSYQGPPDRSNRYHWFERVALTDQNSPAYVRENLAAVRTRQVPTNYKAHRLALYGHDGSHPGNAE